jgi:hypothetical protein
MKFRKKPVTIDAMQFKTNNDDGSSMREIEKWITDNGGKVRNDNTNLYIETLEGTHRADVGDWIIRGVKGEFYPCKPEIFDMTYEKVSK